MQIHIQKHGRLLHHTFLESFLIEDILFILSTVNQMIAVFLLFALCATALDYINRPSGEAFKLMDEAFTGCSVLNQPQLNHRDL